MKINEIEQQVGITKKNIRFYEEQGLLTPRRNLENGYRDYGEDEVEELKRIKLLRKLSIPIEEIRKIQTGHLTLEDAVNRQVIVLKRQESNLIETAKLCTELSDEGCQYQSLLPDQYLNRMDEMEKEGMRFLNVKMDDKKTRMIAPVVITVLFCLLMAGLMGTVIMASISDKPPIIVLVLCILVPVGAMAGILMALRQRMKEIKGGEEDAARKY